MAETMKAKWWLVVAAVMVVGCGEGGGESSETKEEFGETQVVAAFGNFTKNGFARVTKDAVPSQHAVAKKVVVWVQNEHVEAYRAIDPADTTAKAGPFPLGTIVIKQNIADDGSPTGGATVMAKFAEGFNADAADWWWGRFDDGGKLAESGAIGYCIGCHEGNNLARTDYLNGTPPDNQTP